MSNGSNFQDLFPKNWYTKPEESFFWIRIYTMIPVAHSQITKIFSDVQFEINDNGHPVWFTGLGGIFSDLSDIESKILHSDPKTGSIIMPMETRKKNLPLSSYFILACPSIVDGEKLEENAIIQRLNRVEAILSAYLGNNFLHKLVFEAQWSALTGSNKHNVYGEAIATPQSCDGPFVSQDNWRMVQDTFTKINAISCADKKARIKRALEFYQSGKATKDIGAAEKFFFYWTAITVLCGGEGTMDINRRFQKIYGMTQQEVETHLRWKDVLNLRNNFFKQGKSINFHKEIERYLQFLFLDLLRHEIGLSPINASLNSVSKLDLNSLNDPASS